MTQRNETPRGHMHTAALTVVASRFDLTGNFVAVPFTVPGLELAFDDSETFTGVTPGSVVSIAYEFVREQRYHSTTIRSNLFPVSLAMIQTTDLKIWRVPS